MSTCAWPQCAPVCVAPSRPAVCVCVVPRGFLCRSQKCEQVLTCAAQLHICRCLWQATRLHDCCHKACGAPTITHLSADVAEPCCPAQVRHTHTVHLHLPHVRCDIATARPTINIPYDTPACRMHARRPGDPVSRTLSSLPPCNTHTHTPTHVCCYACVGWEYSVGQAQRRCVMRMLPLVRHMHVSHMHVRRNTQYTWYQIAGPPSSEPPPPPAHRWRFTRTRMAAWCACWAWSWAAERPRGPSASAMPQSWRTACCSSWYVFGGCRQLPVGG